ncbi:MAG: DUF1788 domain-containing protein [Lachnospiraceae bacterium]|jgi:hypothetical protein|nr:DUF1788 domain-containing protein [Lachnospiraceae bacterium]
MADVEDRLNQMEILIKNPSFRRTKGKANEVNYWVFDYAPEEELAIRERIDYLKEKNLKGTEEFELVVYDLYDLIMEHLQKKGFLEKCYAMEEKRGIVKVASAVQRSLKITDKENLIVEYIVEHTPTDAVVFLTGVGKCYPILQAPEVFNKILYNMPQSFANIPMVLFYPGTYTEQELIIFNEYSEDNYYRAFRLVR